MLGRLVLTLVLAAACTLPTVAAADCPMPPKPANLAPATVERVSDGDTVMLRFPDGRRQRTRLLGIDAPESRENPKLARDATRTGQDRATIQALGREATAFVTRLLEDRPVEVEQDVERRDQYKRLLAYLWLSDGSMVNVTIVREGYAQPSTKSPNVRYAALRLSAPFHRTNKRPAKPFERDATRGGG
jgi:endonuclease YncB( thermonuclease family)